VCIFVRRIYVFFVNPCDEFVDVCILIRIFSSSFFDWAMPGRSLSVTHRASGWPGTTRGTLGPGLDWQFDMVVRHGPTRKVIVPA
jgi:hypothetical protein